MRVDVSQNARAISRSRRDGRVPDRRFKAQAVVGICRSQAWGSPVISSIVDEALGEQVSGVARRRAFVAQAQFAG